jgi:hypothetical protein
MKYVEEMQKRIVYGSIHEWNDVEADEVDVAKGDDEPLVMNPKKPIVWEQWGGIVERGAPESLMLTRLAPSKTIRRAPGPGPIRKRDWKPLAEKYLRDKKVVLCTDGARSYKLRIPGVMHTWVVHKKKRVKIGGTWRWIKPKFVKLHTHYLPPNGRKLVVKAGTQIIDRFWSHLRSHLRSGPRRPGSINLRRRVRSAQWTYWYRGQDLWAKTCEMLKYSFSKFK